jgi:hypothetical protein
VAAGWPTCYRCLCLRLLSASGVKSGLAGPPATLLPVCVFISDGGVKSGSDAAWLGGLLSAEVGGML